MLISIGFRRAAFLNAVKFDANLTTAGDRGIGIVQKAGFVGLYQQWDSKFIIIGSVFCQLAEIVCMNSLCHLIGYSRQNSNLTSHCGGFFC